MITYIISIKQFKDKVRYLFGGKGVEVSFILFFIFYANSYNFYLGIFRPAGSIG